MGTNQKTSGGDGVSEDQCYCVNPVLVLSMNMCGNCSCRIDSSQPRGKDLWEGYVYRNGKWVWQSVEVKA